jgi:hypothetical protein
LSSIDLPLKKSTRTIIDIGGVLNGLIPTDVFKIVKSQYSDMNKFIYWDMCHEPKSIGDNEKIDYVSL